MKRSADISESFFNGIRMSTYSLKKKKTEDMFNLLLESQRSIPLAVTDAARAYYGTAQCFDTGGLACLHLEVGCVQNPGYSRLQNWQSSGGYFFLSKLKGGS